MEPCHWPLERNHLALASVDEKLPPLSTVAASSGLGDEFLLVFLDSGLSFLCRRMWYGEAGRRALVLETPLRPLCSFGCVLLAHGVLVLPEGASSAS